MTHIFYGFGKCPMGQQKIKAGILCAVFLQNALQWLRCSYFTMPALPELCPKMPDGGHSIF